MALVAVLDTGSDLIANAHEAIAAMEALLADATRAIAACVIEGGRVSRQAARSRTARRSWAPRGLPPTCRRYASSALMRSVRVLPGASARPKIKLGAHRLGEYLAQMLGGILMSQGDQVRGRPRSILEQVSERVTPAVEELIASGNIAENRARLVALMREHVGATVGDCGLR